MSFKKTLDELPKLFCVYFLGFLWNDTLYGFSFLSLCKCDVCSSSSSLLYVTLSSRDVNCANYPWTKTLIKIDIFPFSVSGYEHGEKYTQQADMLCSSTYQPQWQVGRRETLDISNPTLQTHWTHSSSAPPPASPIPPPVLVLPPHPPPPPRNKTLLVRLITFYTSGNGQTNLIRSLVPSLPIVRFIRSFDARLSRRIDWVSWTGSTNRRWGKASTDGNFATKRSDFFLPINKAAATVGSLHASERNSRIQSHPPPPQVSSGFVSLCIALCVLSL